VPGPAHPASDGCFPQQEVSEGPGWDCGVRPVNELVADMSFFVPEAPQAGQTAAEELLNTRTSPLNPQLLQ